MKESEKQQYLKNVVSVVRADGVLGPEEEALASMAIGLSHKPRREAEKGESK